MVADENIYCQKENAVFQTAHIGYSEAFMGGDGGRPAFGGILYIPRIYRISAVALGYGGTAMDSAWDDMFVLPQHGEIRSQRGRHYF